MIKFKRREPAEISINKIRTNPNQPRKHFDEEELKELSNSIKEFGIIQPIIVSEKSDDVYFLIAGERRLKAALSLGYEKIPAIIRNADDKNTALIALVENIQRKDLSYLEEAEAYKRLIDYHGFTQTEIAMKVGKRQSTISNKIRILSLSQEVLKCLNENGLSERHARALLRIADDETRMKVINKIITCDLNVSQTESMIDELLNKRSNENRSIGKLKIINYKLYVNTIKKAFSYISDVEKEATFNEQDLGEFMELRIVIPKRTSIDKSILKNLKHV